MAWKCDRHKDKFPKEISDAFSIIIQTLLNFVDGAYRQMIRWESCWVSTRSAEVQWTVDWWPLFVLGKPMIDLT